MFALDILLNWVHVLGAVIFLGGMFVATFGMMPVLKTQVAQGPRHQFVVHFIPKVRAIMRVVVGALVVSGIARAALLHYTADAPASAARLGVFGAKVAFALVPVAIFVLAPKILGKHSPDGLCCDPDAEGPDVKWIHAATGVMTSTGSALHYAAISGGWLAVLGGIILAHMR